jgi:hypothetical protein
LGTEIGTEKLKISRHRGLLVNRSSHSLGPHGKALLAALDGPKSQGLVKKIGFKPDLVQWLSCLHKPAPKVVDASCSPTSNVQPLASAMATMGSIARRPVGDASAVDNLKQLDEIVLAMEHCEDLPPSDLSWADRDLVGLSRWAIAR